MRTLAEMSAIIGTIKPWQPPEDGFDYQVTEHPCPTCGQALYIVAPSTMLVCNNNDHGPFYLIKE